jgi:hypothetical protein
MTLGSPLVSPILRAVRYWPIGPAIGDGSESREETPAY